ncbi:hypothetical protein PpBr36_08576 [Pyricularia pennisetigena]|uniref:hypothetical protein n=1 Tax=Pyricularia pennisetigena TaxID=1578925 RepID=UPI00114F4037|nr:hypothetical protein PpBr36_08576 [Pyricularia pennisetigena]TLS23852.1 hypothetical protein PpBr36_08576 [Pyricularia pennisetigena]
MPPSLTGAAQTCTETSRQILHSAALCCLYLYQWSKASGPTQVGNRNDHVVGTHSRILSV